ncbi:hypothetical protein LI328DRAFT_160892 [Trichoderma asperelloides]|nr:hypothetical protein LI328DRAFT_160892 [Trichoderma asperelloides]
MGWMKGPAAGLKTAEIKPRLFEYIYRAILDVQSIDERKAQIDDFVSRMKGKCCFSHPLGEEDVDGNSESTGKDLEQFGYASTMDSELKTALQALPSRQCLDALVDHFLTDVNYRYYIVHPEMFRQEYNQWWTDRDDGKPLGLQWTSLLLMVCACSTQHPNDAIRQVLRADQAPPAPELSNRLHSAACELHVQQLLHSFFWLKTRSCYADCWGALKNAFLVFRGLNEMTSTDGGIEKQIYSDGSSTANRNEVSNYLEETGKRAWVVMTSWNWRLSAIISCPLMFRSTEYNIELPSLHLDGHPRESSRSPIVSTALQCMLADSLLEKFGPPPSFGKALETEDPSEEHKFDNDQNHKTFDDENSEKEDYQPPSMPDHLPDNISWRDTSEGFDANLWVALKKFILSVMRLSSTLDSLRSHLIKPLSQASPITELQSRQRGLRVALKYMNWLFKFLRFIFPDDANYHTLIFLIFDVATLLCSAIMHDSDSSMPMRVTSWEAVQSTLCMLKKLSNKAPIAKQAYEVLSPIYNEMLKLLNKDDVHQRKRPRLMNPDGAESRRESVLLGQSDRLPKVYNFTSDLPEKSQTGRFRVYPLYPFSSNMRFYMDPFPTQSIPPKWESDDITTTQLHLTQRTLETLLPSIPSADDVGTLQEVNHVPEVKHSAGDVPLGIMEGLWDYDRVNLEFLSPQIDH